MTPSTGCRPIARPRSIEPVYLAGVPRRVWFEEALRLVAALAFLVALCLVGVLAVVALGGVPA